MIRVFHEHGMFLCSEIIISDNAISFYNLNGNLKYNIKFLDSTQSNDYFKSISKLDIIDLTQIDSKYQFVQKYDSMSLIYT